VAAASTELRASGFAHAEVLTYWSDRMRYFGDPQIIVVARKATSPPRGDGA